MRDWKQWARAAAVRSLKTICQTAVGMLSGNMAGLLDVDWVAVASVSLLAGLVSVLTSVAGLPEVGVKE